MVCIVWGLTWPSMAGCALSYDAYWGLIEWAAGRGGCGLWCQAWPAKALDDVHSIYVFFLQNNLLGAGYMMVMKANLVLCLWSNHLEGENREQRCKELVKSCCRKNDNKKAGRWGLGKKGVLNGHGGWTALPANLWDKQGVLMPRRSLNKV